MYDLKVSGRQIKKKDLSSIEGNSSNLHSGQWAQRAFFKRGYASFYE